VARTLKVPPKPAIRQPMPPAKLGEWDGNARTLFLPAPEVRQWMVETFIAEGAPMLNEDHEHLRSADFEVLWAAGGYAKQGRFVLGTTEEVGFRAGGWQKERQEYQMLQWFGRIPDYLITLDGSFAREASDGDWCALVEHELYHIGQRTTFGGAREFKQDGSPKLFIRGHDVEEFVGVVARYGVGDPEGALSRLVKAANAGATASPLRISQACGTCLLRAA
jgi:hypothetical protein